MKIAIRVVQTKSDVRRVFRGRLRGSGIELVDTGNTKDDLVRLPLVAVGGVAVNGFQ